MLPNGSVSAVIPNAIIYSRIAFGLNLSDPNNEQDQHGCNYTHILHNQVLHFYFSSFEYALKTVKGPYGPFTDSGRPTDNLMNLPEFRMSR